MLPCSSAGSCSRNSRRASRTWRLQRLVDQVEPVARRDQLQRQRDQPLAIGRAQALQLGRVGAADQRAIVGQVVRADEAELPEVLVIRRQIGEQLDHRARELEPDLEQRLDQPGLGEDLLHVGLRGEVLDVEGLADRLAEQQVLGERGVGVVALGIEHLDQPAELRIPQALAHRPARLEEARGQLRLRLGVDRAAQPHLVDVAVELDHGRARGRQPR